MKRSFIRTVSLAIAALILTTGLAAGALAIESFGTMAQYQKSVLTYTNTYRSTNKLASLTLDDTLCQLAEKLAAEQKGYMQNLRPGGQSWESILDEYGYTYETGKAGRNVLISPTNKSGLDLVKSFMQTSSSKNNLLNKDFTHTGVYVHYFLDEQVYYFVQIFAKPTKQSDALQTIATTTTKINVRTGPGTSHSIIGSLKKGEQVTIVSYAGKWAKIKWQNNAFAYVHADYLLYKGSTQGGIPVDLPKMTNATTKSAAAYYEGPSTAYKKLGTIPKGQPINVILSYYENGSQKWFEVPYNGKNVFVQISDVKLDSDIRLTDIPISPPKGDSGDLGSATATAKVNVRTGPGTGYGKLGTLQKGTIVAVWKMHGKWAEITYQNGKVHAYVHADYLRFNEG